MKLYIQSALPDKSITHFVHSFWMLENKTGKDIPTTVLPNGMVDLTLMKKRDEGWKLFLRGIDTAPSTVVIENDDKIFTIGFKLLAVDSLLGQSIRDFLNTVQPVSHALWQFEENDMNGLENFCKKATEKIKTISTLEIDSRKKKLFELIYSSNGSIAVKELADKVFWSSRQINRYFNQHFGISPKAYCRLLRLGSSFKHISEGKLFPEQAFTDQNHFIKEVKKYAGVTPKELSKNIDDRFIDITAIKKFPP